MTVHSFSHLSDSDECAVCQMGRVTAPIAVEWQLCRHTSSRAHSPPPPPSHLANNQSCWHNSLPLPWPPSPPIPSHLADNPPWPNFTFPSAPFPLASHAKYFWKFHPGMSFSKAKHKTSSVICPDLRMTLEQISILCSQTLHLAAGLLLQIRARTIFGRLSLSLLIFKTLNNWATLSCCH